MPRETIHLFLSHGLESGPGSTKIQAMKRAAEAFPGVRAEAVDHRSSKEPDIRLQQMRAAMEKASAEPARTILAGSSMGGWVCAQTSAHTPVLGCFLLAPALALPRYPQSRPVIQARHTRIIHGWDDDVVPVMPVLELAREQRINTLVLADGHRLQNSVDTVVREFTFFLESCLSELNPS
ncbi:YqiA/YcfP family alpha/beta fold hydrolase [Marinobacter sp. DUT-1]|uniref:YqiA/YcfP family alpha/beta fold hydrolase n=1 Tax=Marinobacter sp. DUT-1 TaxID=3412037 RepID=UPI003D1710B0